MNAQNLEIDTKYYEKKDHLAKLVDISHHTI